MSNKNRQDWGCLQWFLLGFAILAVAVFLLVMLTTPSGGGGSCQSMNVQGVILVRKAAPEAATRSSSTTEQPLKTIVAEPLGRVDVHPVQLAGKPGPGAGPKAPAPAKPNLNKQGPAKPGLGQQKPSKAPGKPHKAPKVDLDMDDCD